MNHAGGGGGGGGGAEGHVAPDDDEGIADLTEENESTSSIRSSLLNYPTEHGRQFHAYKSGSYHRPNDETELDRLDLMHAMFGLVLDGKLFMAPISPTSDESNSEFRILDMGAGTGIWCIDMGDLYPLASILGVDISASAPTFVPPNVRFEIDDLEDPWTYSQPFDYIHGRYLAGSIKDWPALIGRCFEFLKPGGWIELMDFDIWWYSQDNTLTEEHALRRYMVAAHKTQDISGRMFCPGHRLEGWVRDAGFANVDVVKSLLPIGTWPRDKRMKTIGAYNWTQLWEGLEGFSLRLFIGMLGWGREELEVLLMECRRNLRDPKMHPMMDLYTVWAQKPL